MSLVKYSQLYILLLNLCNKLLKVIEMYLISIDGVNLVIIWIRIKFI